MTKRLLADGIILSEEEEIVKYGLENLKSNLTGFLLTLLIGACFHCLLESAVLWMLNFPLRKNAGGFHAETKMKCILLSAAILLAAMGGLVRIIWSPIVYIGITLVSFVFILYLAPVENLNKRLDKLERRVYGERTRMILVIEGTLFVIAMVLDWDRLIAVSVANFAIVGVSLVAGKQKLKKMNRRYYYDEKNGKVFNINGSVCHVVVMYRVGKKRVLLFQVEKHRNQI